MLGNSYTTVVPNVTVGSQVYSSVQKSTYANQVPGSTTLAPNALYNKPPMTYNIQQPSTYTFSPHPEAFNKIYPAYQVISGVPPFHQQVPGPFAPSGNYTGQLSGKPIAGGPKRKKFVIKRHEGAWCGFLNRNGLFDSGSGRLGCLNVGGCCDRDRTTYKERAGSAASVEGGRRTNQGRIC